MPIEFEKFIKIVYERWKAKLPVKPGGHLDEEDLAGLLEGRLSPVESARVKEHIISCSECGQKLALAIRLGSMPESEPPEKLVQSSQKLIEQAISDQTLEIVLQVKNRLLELIDTTGAVLVGRELFPAGVLRSRKIQELKNEFTVLKDLGNLRIEITVRAKPKDHFDLKVTVNDRKAKPWKKELRISLFKDGRELESYLCASGQAIFENAAIGKYAVEISELSGGIAGVLIEIKGGGNGQG